MSVDESVTKARTRCIEYIKRLRTGHPHGYTPLTQYIATVRAIQCIRFGDRNGICLDMGKSTARDLHHTLRNRS